MNDPDELPNDELIEKNTARLIQSGYAPEARPDPKAHRRLFQQLTAELRSKAAPADFPDKALGLLGVAGGVLAVWLIVQVGGLGLRVLDSERWIALAAPLLINLLLAPVASVIIIIQRRKHG